MQQFIPKTASDINRIATPLWGPPKKWERIIFRPVRTTPRAPATLTRLPLKQVIMGACRNDFLNASVTCTYTFTADLLTLMLFGQRLLKVLADTRLRYMNKGDKTHLVC